MVAVFGGRSAVSGQFWLLGAPDDLQDQSLANPDGAGIAWFDPQGTPQLDRAPLAALDDPAFARDARSITSRAILAHVRHSSGTARRLENTMPFTRDGRLFAHNGALDDLQAVEREAGSFSAGFAGDTDSERFLALITQRAARRADLAAGVVDAALWLARTVPVLSLNCILATPDELVVLRYPETDSLWLLPSDGAHGAVSGTGSDGPVRLVGEDDGPRVVVASEPLDGNPGWRSLEPGELVHVDAALRITSRVELPDPPARRLVLNAT